MFSQHLYFIVYCLHNTFNCRHKQIVNCSTTSFQQNIQHTLSFHEKGKKTYIQYLLTTEQIIIIFKVKKFILSEIMDQWQLNVKFHSYAFFVHKSVRFIDHSRMCSKINENFLTS